MFDVIKHPLPFNGILGCPALDKFTEAYHYAYNTLKMSGSMGVISIPPDKRDAVIWLDMMYRDAVAAEAIEALAPTKEGKMGKNARKDTDKDPKKRASS